MRNYSQQIGMILSASYLLEKPQNYALAFLGATTLFVAPPLVKVISAQSETLQLTATQQGFNLTLTTNSNQRPQMLTMQQDKVLVADLEDTQLNMGANSRIQRNNPFPGVEFVSVSQDQGNRVRVLVKGSETAPKASLESFANGQVTLSFNLEGGDAQEVAQAQPQQEQTFSQNSGQSQQPEVMFPNPEVTIDGQVAQNDPQGRLSTPSLQPTRPRAVAPPVGDIAVSTINSSPDMVNLGTNTRVPRLVLREAPVREVLSLLARSANVNLVFADQGGGEEGVQQTISVDLENEPVQAAFNSILQLSGLEANRRGNTIFVGANLPQQVRNIMTRTLRLNQVTVSAASGFLATQGAEVQQVVVPIEREFNQETGAIIRETEQPAELRPLTATAVGESRGALLLRGLSVATDERLNSITLIGEPNKISTAIDLLQQLDARRRQVAVNVKIIDVSLDNEEDFNASVSFGIGDTFFVSDNGAAALSFGGAVPPTRPDVINSPITPTVIQNPFSGANTFINLDETVPVPTTEPGLTIIDETTGQFSRSPRGTRNFFTRGAGVSENPLEAEISEITIAENDIITISRNAETGELEFDLQEGTVGEVVGELPDLFQFPTDFLSLLQAQIQSGNAKILTDPTLLIQEGQTAGVNLTQEVVGNIIRETESSEGLTTVTTTAEIQEAGLTLNVDVQRIDDNGFITLNVNPTVTSIGGVQDLSVGGDTNQIVLLNIRELNSGEIRLRDGQTLIVAGIIQDEDRTTVSKVPILGDLPIIGSLFRSTSRDSVRQEVIVLLTPNVVDDSLGASGYGSNYQLSPSAREVLEQQGYPIPRRGR